ncbi:MAG: hypothetical protein GYB67_09170 [Chloroflexi bacterium]|nr:hypothetical protein [Chloroflexota bacterium]
MTMALKVRRLIALLALIGAISACTAAPQTPTPAVERPQAKLLATVFMSPTPGEAARQATRIASRPTLPVQMPLPTAQPTAYVGVFVAAAGEDGGAPALDAAAQFSPPTPVPALAAGGCAIPPAPLFGENWTQNEAAQQALGCAGEPIAPYVGTTQLYERGVMYWLPSGEIWSIAPEGAVGGPYWYAPFAPPEQGWSVPVPEGLRMPEGGFGAVWRAIPGIRETLGLARTPEQPVSLSLQRFEGGALLLDGSAGQVFILIGRGETGTAYGPY